MLYITKEGEIVNTDPANDYFDKVNELLDQWNSGREVFELRTSGSTGRPKEILVKRSQIEASIELSRKALKINQDDLFFCCLNVNYIAGMMMLLRAAHIGCDIIVVEPTSNPFDSLGKMEYLITKNQGKNFFSFVPLQLQTILESENGLRFLKSAKVIIVGGAAINKVLRDKVIETKLPVFETYGMTETISHVALKNVSQGHDYFKAIEGVDIEANTNNCLRILSSSTENDWVQTNDVVDIVGKGCFVLKGRADNIINSGGVKIQLEEIERKLADHFQWPNRYFCYGKADEKLGQKLVLVIESHEKIVDLTELTPIFSKFEVPKEIFFVKNFAETASAKVDKIRTINEIISY